MESPFFLQVSGARGIQTFCEYTIVVGVVVHGSSDALSIFLLLSGELDGRRPNEFGFHACVTYPSFLSSFQEDVHILQDIDTKRRVRRGCT